MKRLLSWSFLPVCLCGSIGLLYLLVGASVPYPAAAMLTTIAGMLAIALTERIVPYRAGGPLVDDEWTTDVQHLLFTQAALAKALTVSWTFLLVSIGSFVHRTEGESLLPWPHGWHPAAQFLLALLVIGLGRYWAHRIGHESRIWWKFHAVHHASNHLYWLNAGRWNPFDKALVAMSEIVPFVAFGMSPEVVALYTVVVSFNSFMQHANIDIRMSWLNYVVNSTELHRWHHSTVISESNTNYGNPLTLFDILFGTFFYPAPGSSPEVMGLVPARHTTGYLDDLTYPFRELGAEWEVARRSERERAAR